MNSDRQMGWSRDGSVVAGAGQLPAPATIEAAVHDSPMPFWALMAFTFILLIAPQTFFPILGSLRIALVAAVLAVVTYLLDRIVRRRPMVHFTREMTIAGCLLGWAVVTMPFSYWPGGSVSVLSEIYIKTLIVFWLLGHVVNSLARLRTVFWGLSLMAVPLAVSAVQKFLSGDFYTGGMLPGHGRILGYEAPLTTNPNDLALMLNLILPLSIALFLGTSKLGTRVLLLVVIGLDVLGIVATFSRAGFLTMTVTFASFLWILRKRGERSWIFLVLILVLAMAPFIPSSYVDRLGTITNVESDPTGSAQARWHDTVAAAKYVALHPVLGAGLGMNPLALNEVRGATWLAVHNVYLQYGVDLGLPGLILFLMLLIGCIKSVRQVQHQSSTRRPDSAELFCLAEGIQISLIAFSIAAFFHPAGYHFYFYYIAGLAVAAKTINAGFATPPAALSAAREPTRRGRHER